MGLRVASALLVATILPGAEASAVIFQITPDGGAGHTEELLNAMRTAAPGDTVALRYGYYDVTDLEVAEGVLFLGGWNDDFTARTPRTSHIHATGSLGDFRQALMCTQAQTAATVIDGLEVSGNNARGLTCVGASPTVTNNHFHDHNMAQNGGAIFFRDGSSPLIENNVFANNSSGYGGAISSAFGPGNSAVIRDNVIEYNHATGGSGIQVSGGSPLIENNVIRHNTGEKGLFIWSAGPGELPIVRGNLLIDNEGPGIHVYRSEALIENNTVWGNGGDAVWVQGGIGYPDPVFHRNILGGTSAGYGVRCDEASPTLSCNCVFDATLGAFGNCPVGVDNIQLDPLFCGPESGNFTLQADSPCAAANNAVCGLIGAEDVGCGPVSVEPVSWGRVKALHRD